MRLLDSTLLLGLAWFAAANLAVSLVAWVASRFVLRSRHSSSGDLLLGLRLLPSCASLLFALGVFVPAHLRFEPVESDEQFGVVLTLLALAGSALVVHSVWRLGRVWSAARRANRWPAWPVASAFGETFEVAGFPGVSLAGVVRTRILIGPGAREALSREELALAVAHEHAHRGSLDNLKRCAMFCAPDFFRFTAVALHLEHRWRARAERDADMRAVGGDTRRALHLASALLKVARMNARPGGRAPLPVWSAFNEPTFLETRVLSLVSGRVPTMPPPHGHRRRIALAFAAGTVPFLALAQAPLRIHQITEALVAVLP